MQQPQGPLELGLLASDVVPHLAAHVFPARVEAQHPSPLLLLVGGTGAASEAQTQLPRLSVASLHAPPPPTPRPGMLHSCSPPPRNFRAASASCLPPSLTQSCSSAPLRADTLSHLADPSHRLDTLPLSVIQCLHHSTPRPLPHQPPLLRPRPLFLASCSCALLLPLPIPPTSHCPFLTLRLIVAENSPSRP